MTKPTDARPVLPARHNTSDVCCKSHNPSKPVDPFAECPICRASFAFPNADTQEPLIDPVLVKTSDQTFRFDNITSIKTDDNGAVELWVNDQCYARFTTYDYFVRGLVYVVKQDD